jgi:hypothetical protein
LCPQLRAFATTKRRRRGELPQQKLSNPIVRIEILKDDPKRSRQGFERKARKVGFARGASRPAATTISTSSGAIFNLVGILLSSVARFPPS